MSKMIAKTKEGKEFSYNPAFAYEVSNAGAAEICKALNAARWNLKDGEKWHIYEFGWYERVYTEAGRQKFIRRQGRIYVSKSGNGW